MKLQLLKGRTKRGYVTFGGVWAKGEAVTKEFTLQDGHGLELPMQSKVTAWWPDGSVKWSAHTVMAENMPYTVYLTPKERAKATEEKISRQQTEEGAKVATGKISQQQTEEGAKATEEKISQQQTEEGAKVETGKFSQQQTEEGIQVATGKISLQQTEEGIKVETGNLSLLVPHAGGRYLAKQIMLGDTLLAEGAYPVFLLERKTETDTSCILTQEEFQGEITSVELEEAGELSAVFCFRGNHIPTSAGNAKMPFVIRMLVGAESEELHFYHTFLYDGVEEWDFLKGMGIRLEVCLSEKLYDRHIQYGTDGVHFHEAAVLLSSNHPRLSPKILMNQLEGGECLSESEELLASVEGKLPVWNQYTLYQDSAYHYSIHKNTEKGCCRIRSREGRRAMGTMAVSSRKGSILFGIRDFWQKYPSGLAVAGLGEEKTFCTAWFYCPEAESYDFRHYSKHSYPDTCYEGFSYVGASAAGIGVTSECRIKFAEEFIGQEKLREFSDEVQKPPVFVGDAEYYYEKKAFGCYGEVKAQSEVERWLEEQLDRAFLFYQREVEERDWYGLFDYGDVMHTYDAVRHTWKYDFGGMAWQNTELVPTYWLWLYFLRTGREDVFTMAEAMSRHCSEVDIYHFGPLKGLGSRHNVRHWGCSCKEPRISMAGHHRFLYYLTGDARLRDIFEEVKDADVTMIARQKERNKYVKGFELGVRSGPDWSSFVSNWMTWYEITLDAKYREKIENGIVDIMASPYGFASGPDYGYDTATAHLIYRGEMENTPNQHLQICMGGPQVWLETADMLKDDRLRLLLEKLGTFYYLEPEKKAELTEGKIKERPFSWPMFAAGIAGLSAAERKDEALAVRSWQILIGDLWEKGGKAGFAPEGYETDALGKEYEEIPWITTNTTAQWCLNVMMNLAFIREYLPKTMEELEKWMTKKGNRADEK